LFRNYGEGTNNWAVDQIRRWLHLNDKFPISYYTMGELLRSHLKLAEEQGYRDMQDATLLPSFKEMKRIPNIDNFDSLSDYTNACIDIVLTATIKILDSDRRLAVICVEKTFAEKWYSNENTGFHYGWVPGNSVPGDKIALLPSCTVPVVLRPRPAGGFWIVGDVCAKMLSKSGIETEFTDNWPEIEIY
jgi:hypothetical protein